MPAFVFFLVVVACPYAVPALRRRGRETKSQQDLGRAPFGKEVNASVDKFAETLKSVASVETMVGVDGYTKSELSKIHLNTLPCDISGHLKQNLPPLSIFKLEAQDMAKKVAEYSDDIPIKHVVDFLLYPDDLDGLTLDDDANNETQERLQHPCLRVSVLKDAWKQIWGKVDWIDSRCQSGNAMMSLSDKLFQCFGVQEASLNNISSLHCRPLVTEAEEKQPPDNRVGLSLLRTLTHGQSWYQKFGYEFAGWEPEDLDFLTTFQQALHAVSYSELRNVWAQCGQPKVSKENVKLSRRISELFLIHESVLNSERENGTLSGPAPGTIGYFAAWLVDEHCDEAQQVLVSSLVFPCQEYNDDFLKGLYPEVLRDIGFFAGAKIKRYSSS